MAPAAGYGDRVKITRPRVIDAGTSGTGADGVALVASGRVGIQVIGGLFERIDTSAAYRSGVGIFAATSAIVAGNRGIGLGYASGPFIQDSGTTSVLADNVALTTGAP